MWGPNYLMPLQASKCGKIMTCMNEKKENQQMVDFFFIQICWFSSRLKNMSQRKQYLIKPTSLQDTSAPSKMAAEQDDSMPFEFIQI